MIGVSPEKGSGCGRRLPLWMLGVSGPGKLKKPDNGNGDNNPLEEQLASEALHPKDKTGLAQNVAEIDGKLGVETSLHSLGQCEMKRMKRNSCGQDAETDRKAFRASSDNRKRKRLGKKLQECAPRRKGNARSKGYRGSNEVESQNDGDKGQLTAEDLLRIAEKYVKDGIHVERPKSSNVEPQLATDLSDNVSKSCDNESNNISRSMNNSCSTLDLPGKQNFRDTGRTGNPAQDMLDLFLGPLLKKTRVEERNFEEIANDTMFNYDFQKETLNDNAPDEMPPVMKKKSSLKDMVSRLLD